MNGLAFLLNTGVADHLTVFVADFMLSRVQRERVTRQFGAAATRLEVIIATSPADIEQQLSELLNRYEGSYVSLQLFSNLHETYGVCSRLFAALPRGDMARLELPLKCLGFEEAHLDHLLGVLETSDFAEQERYSSQFFRLLERTSPYSVEIFTPGNRLLVTGRHPWFQLAGPLTAGERRILPGGEVAYTGDEATGTFLVDGTLLPTPQTPGGEAVARELGALMPALADDPVTFTIERGRVSSMQSRGVVAAKLRALLSRPAYAKLVEVGVSFNRACRELVWSWPSSANEGYPGAHIGVGGDPENAAVDEALVHIDFISANASIVVNGAPFLTTSDLLGKG